MQSRHVRSSPAQHGTRNKQNQEHTNGNPEHKTETALPIEQRIALPPLCVRLDEPHADRANLRSDLRLEIRSCGSTECNGEEEDTMLQALNTTNQRHPDREPG